MSPTRQRIIEAITRFQQDKGYPPTIREIGKMVGLSSTCTVQYHVQRLVSEGYLKQGAKGITRSLTVESSQGITPLRDAADGLLKACDNLLSAIHGVSYIKGKEGVGEELVKAMDAYERARK